jgi:hypothetical protein
MTPTTPPQDLATQWKNARELYPIYFELAREFAIEVETCNDLEVQADTPGKEAVEQANQWLEKLDNSVQVHQLRQFLQTSSLVNQEGLLSLLRHFLAKATKTDAVRDKIDFLLVQYFSQIMPAGVDDARVDLAYVAHAMDPVVGQVELKPPVWLNSLDRVLELSRKCRSLDELLHGGVLEQGRKAKGQAGDLFYMPIALVAFTRFGYLMRRAFFRLMLGDLNIILDGLTELEEKGVQTIDCRRAQFSAQEPIIRLRMICQSWKVMFQAEYSSGSPLRMLVDLRASVDSALGRGKATAADTKANADAATKPIPPAKPAAGEKPALSAKPAATAKPAAGKPASAKPASAKPASGKPATANVVTPAKPADATKPATKPAVTAKPAGATAKPAPAATRAAVAPGSTAVGTPKAAAKQASAPPSGRSKAAAANAAANSSAPEFEISAAPGWDPDQEPQGKK